MPQRTPGGSEHGAVGQAVLTRRPAPTHLIIAQWQGHTQCVLAIGGVSLVLALSHRSQLAQAARHAGALLAADVTASDAVLLALAVIAQRAALPPYDDLVLRGIEPALALAEMEEKTMHDLLELVRAIACQLPTGLHDPRALEKMHAEQDELTEKHDAADRIGVLTEVADVAYYACKAHLNGLMSVTDAQAEIAAACASAGIDATHAPALISAKYATRVRGSKDDAAERAALAALNLA